LAPNSQRRIGLLVAGFVLALVAYVMSARGSVGAAVLLAWIGSSLILNRLHPIIAVLLGFFGGLFVATAGMDKPSPTAAAPAVSATQEARRSTPRQVAAPQPALRVEELLQAYESNEVAADARYKGKTIRIAGIVGDIKKDILNNPYVTVGTGAEFEIPVAQCMLAASSEGKAARLSQGQRIVVQGKVDGLLMNVLLSNCVIQ
jgi:hypothetical protein